MVHQREGAGKFSSPHSVKDFGDQIPPKWGGVFWIGSLYFFFIHQDDFRVEKVEELVHRTIFTDDTKFGKLGSKTFQEHFEASNDIFWGKTLFLWWNTFFLLFSTQRPFQRHMKRINERGFSPYIDKEEPYWRATNETNMLLNKARRHSSLIMDEIYYQAMVHLSILSCNHVFLLHVCCTYGYFMLFMQFILNSSK